MKEPIASKTLRFKSAIVVLAIGLLLMACSGGIENTSDPDRQIDLPFSDDFELPNESLTESPSASLDTPTTYDGDNGADSPSPRGTTRQPPSIKILRPEKGATVPETFEMEVAVENFELTSAGRSRAGEGHWHVLVDVGCMPAGELIPSGSNHFHAGDGSATRTLQLLPGPHELCVQIGDGFHIAVNITKTIRITVR